MIWEHGRYIKDGEIPEAAVAAAAVSDSVTAAEILH
jgi:hypothetical protein